jgi:hypothetical protein
MRFVCLPAEPSAFKCSKPPDVPRLRPRNPRQTLHSRQRIRLSSRSGGASKTPHSEATPIGSRPPQTRAGSFKRLYRKHRRPSLPVTPTALRAAALPIEFYRFASTMSGATLLAGRLTAASVVSAKPDFLQIYTLREVRPYFWRQAELSGRRPSPELCDDP